MFKAKRIDTGEVETILAVDYYDAFHQTYFFVWSNDAWRWRPAHRYVPPNVNPEDVAPINVRTSIQSGDIIDEDPPFKEISEHMEEYWKTHMIIPPHEDDPPYIVGRIVKKENENVYRRRQNN